MNNYKRFISSITLLALLVTWPSLAYGQEISSDGDYLTIKQGEKAPYNGYLFDSSGLIKIMVNKSLELDKLRITKEAEIAKLTIEIEYLKKQHTLELKIKEDLNNNIVKLKDDRIKLLEEGNRWDDLKLFGSMFLGIVLSVAIFYASVQITNLKQ